MKKFLYVLVICGIMLGSFSVGKVLASPNLIGQKLETIDNAKTIHKTCVKYSPFDYIACSEYIPTGKHVFVYIYSVEGYYKIAYIKSFINGIPQGVYGWVKQGDLKYVCCK